MRCLTAILRELLEKETQVFGLVLDQKALSFLEIAIYLQVPASKTKSITSESSLISFSCGIFVYRVLKSKVEMDFAFFF